MSEKENGRVSTAVESREASHQRIQQLREKLEIYNATIAEAMGTLSGSRADSTKGGAAGKIVDPPPRNDSLVTDSAASAVDVRPRASDGMNSPVGTATAKASTTTGAARESSPAHAPVTSTPSAVSTDASQLKAAMPTASSFSPAPRPARNLAKDFTASSSSSHSPNSDSAKAAVASPKAASAAGKAGALPIGSPDTTVKRADPNNIAEVLRTNTRAKASSPSRSTAGAKPSSLSSSTAPSVPITRAPGSGGTKAAPSATPAAAAAPAAADPPQHRHASHSSRFDDVEYDIEEILASTDDEYEENDFYTSDDFNEGEEDSDDDIAFEQFFHEVLRGDAALREAVQATLERAAERERDGMPSGENSPPTHPLIQRAAELYRQQQQQHRREVGDEGHHHHLQQHIYRQTHHDDDGESTTETSVTDEEDSEDDGYHSSSSPTPSSPAGYLSRNSGSEPRAASAGDIQPSFEELETAHYHLLTVRASTEKALSSTLAKSRFPPPLPMVSECEAVASKRESLAKQEAELRATRPDVGALKTLETGRAGAVEEAATKLLAECEVAAKYFRVVEERQALVDGKSRLLQQRRSDLEERRKAVTTVQDENAKKDKELEARRTKVEARRSALKARAKQHEENEKALQESIAEVENLDKTVTMWMRTLDERESDIATKERRLSHAQNEIMQRMEVVHARRNMRKRSKQPPPPPSRTST